MAGKKPAAPADLFEAADRADVAATAAFLAAGADVHAVNPFGFTALEKAACSADRAPMEDTLATLRLLIDAGSPLEHVGGGGRTALYLAAEFSRSRPDAVQLLVDAGANPDVRSEHGNHVVQNAWAQATKELLSALTGEPIPVKVIPRPPQRMPAFGWRAARKQIDAAFALLEAQAIVTAHAQGGYQAEGHDDTNELYWQRGGPDAGLKGYCFYCGEDMKRAKKTSDLLIAFWGGPDSAAMERIGQAIVDAFTAVGLPVEWDGTERMRPKVDLRPVHA